MNARPGHRLLRLARDVADGHAVDWEQAGLEAGASEATLRGLRRLAAIREAFAQVFEDSEGNAAPGEVFSPFQWGHLEVRERLGAGTFAEVFRAHDPLLDREVALKLLYRGPADSSGWLEEARRLARVRHPNVVVIHGVDVHDDRPGFWTDLVRGASLEERLRQSGPLDEREACQVGIELCRALAAVHTAGIVHGDIKAANVLLEIGGRVVLTDFGAGAELRHTVAAASGTPLVMAPELLDGACPTAASDIYALGVLLYRLVTDCYPVEADSLEALRGEHARVAREGRAVLPGPLGGILDEALAPRSEARLAGAREMERHLIAALGAHGVPATGVPPGGAAGDFPFTDRLLGRDAELCTLQAEFRRSRMGAGFPVIVHGDPGVGKTFLARRFQGWAEDRGATVLYIRFFEEDAGLRSAGEIFGEWIGEIAEPQVPGDAPGSSRQLAQALVALGRQGPLVLIFDDLHWATDACRDVVGYVMRLADGKPVMVLGLTRGEAVTQPGHPASEWLARQAAHRRFTALPLESFDFDRFQVVLNALVPGPAGTSDLPPSVTRRLHELSGGNPYFLAELLRLLVARGALAYQREPTPGWRWHDVGHWRLPDTLVMTTRAILAALRAPVREALESAAVLGDEFDLRTMQQLSGVATEELETLLQEAADAGVLTHRNLSGGADYGFRHALVRQVIVETLPPGRLRDLHGAAADALRETRSERDPALPAALSWHYEAAGATLGTLTWSLAAWRLARAGRQWSHAMTLLERARRALTQCPDPGQLMPQRLELELGQAEAAWHLGLLMHSRECGAAALELAREAGERALEAATLLQQARTGIALGHYRDAERAAEAAVDLFFKLQDHAGVSRSRLQLATARTAMGNYRSAAGVAGKIIAHCAEEATVHAAQALLGWTLALQGRFEEAVPPLRAVVAGAERRADARELALNLRRLHWVHLSCGEFGEAYDLAHRAYELARSADDAFDEAKAIMGMGQSRLGQGLCGEAIAYLRLTLDKLEQMGDSHCQAETLWLLGRAHAESGRLEMARDLLVRALDMVCEIGDRDDEFRFLADLGRVELAARRPEVALSQLDAAMAIAAELGSRDGLGMCRAERALALLALDRVNEAEVDARDAVTLLEETTSAERWRAQWALARVLQGRNDGGAAPQGETLDALSRSVELVGGIRDQVPAEDRLRRREITLLRGAPARELVHLLVATGEMESAARLAAEWELPFDHTPRPESPSPTDVGPIEGGGTSRPEAGV